MVFRQQFCTVRLYWAGATWANEINHALGAGSITRPIDQQSRATTVLRTPPPPQLLVIWIHSLIASQLTVCNRSLHRYLYFSTIKQY